MISQRRLARAGLVAIALAAQACATPPPPDDGLAARIEAERARADAASARAGSLQRDVVRLREDLQQAELALIAIESGLRGVHTRATGVSAIAEARIELANAERVAPWRGDDVREARAKLEEAERQLKDGRHASAIFFASRAQRIAETMRQEAEARRRAPGGSRVAHRANLRSGPSSDERVVGVLPASTPLALQREQGEWVLVETLDGQSGWLHKSLVR